MGGDRIRTVSVSYFTKKEEELTNLLVEIGTKTNIAKVLVFLVNSPEATSRQIERGTDLRQPEGKFSNAVFDGSGLDR